jgi:hypothetical protein
VVRWGIGDTGLIGRNGSGFVATRLLATQGVCHLVMRRMKDHSGSVRRPFLNGTLSIQALDLPSSQSSAGTSPNVAWIRRKVFSIMGIDRDKKSLL